MSRNANLTNISVLRECAEQIARQLDNLTSVVGTGIYVVTDPPWEDAGLGFVKCETVIYAGRGLHEVSQFLKDHYGIEAHLTASKWSRWEWSIHSCRRDEYVLNPELESRIPRTPHDQ